MSFFLRLMVLMYLGCGVCNHSMASSPVDLSFSVYLEINEQFIYPNVTSVEDRERKPYEIIVNISGLTNQNLKDIVLDLCCNRLGIARINYLHVSLISFFAEGSMITHVESCPDSSVSSPVGFANSGSFPKHIDLLTINNDELIKRIQGNSLRVSIISPTDSIRTVGCRLRMRELEDLSKSKL